MSGTQFAFHRPWIKCISHSSHERLLVILHVVKVGTDNAGWRRALLSEHLGEVRSLKVEYFLGVPDDGDYCCSLYDRVIKILGIIILRRINNSFDDSTNLREDMQIGYPVALINLCSLPKDEDILAH